MDESLSNRKLTFMPLCLPVLHSVRGLKWIGPCEELCMTISCAVEVSGSSHFDQCQCMSVHFTGDTSVDCCEVHPPGTGAPILHSLPRLLSLSRTHIQLPSQGSFLHLRPIPAPLCPCAHVPRTSNTHLLLRNLRMRVQTVQTVQTIQNCPVSMLSLVGGLRHWPSHSIAKPSQQSWTWRTSPRL